MRGKTLVPILIAVALAQLSAGRAALAACGPLAETTFSAANALAQVVAFEPVEYRPFDLLGRDVFGRIVWHTSPHATWGLRYGDQGKVVEKVDEFGNHTCFVYDPDGHLIRRDHSMVRAGSWSEGFVYDSERNLVVEYALRPGQSFETRLGATVQPEILIPLLDGSLPGPVTEIEETDVAVTSSMTNAFARVSTWKRVDLSLASDGPFFVESSEILGRSLTVSMERSDRSVTVSDDWGGRREQTYDDLGRLRTVSDSQGPIVTIERGEEGSPTAVWLGRTVVLRYQCDPQGRCSKELIDLRSNEAVLSLAPAIRPHENYQPPHEMTSQPRKVVTAWLPGHGPVAEWDPAFPWRGHATPTLGGLPYALLPLDNSSPPWRSLSLPLGPYSDERIDYTDDRILLHLRIDSGTQNTAHQRILVLMPRYPITASDQGDASLQPSGDTSNLIALCNVNCLCIHRGADLEIRCPDDGGGVGGGGADPGAGDSSPPDGPGGGGPPPILTYLPPGGALTPAQQFSVNKALDRANEKLESATECRDMFEEQELTFTNSDWVVNSWDIYRNGEGHRDSNGNTPCDISSVSAWTVTNTRYVFVCSTFTSMSLSQQTTKVLHEALHTAGLKEKPPCSDAMTPSQIDSFVRSRCGG